MLDNAEDLYTYHQINNKIKNKKPASHCMIKRAEPTLSINRIKNQNKTNKQNLQR